MNNSLIVSKCLLGWAIHGKTWNDEELCEYSNVFSSYCDDVSKETSDSSLENIEQLMKYCFSLDALEVWPVPRRNSKVKRDLKIFENTCHRIDNVWKVGLLWRDDKGTVPNSRTSALNRLHLLERGLDQNLSLASTKMD